MISSDLDLDLKRPQKETNLDKLKNYRSVYSKSTHITSKLTTCKKNDTNMKKLIKNYWANKTKKAIFIDFLCWKNFFKEKLRIVSGNCGFGHIY